MNVPLTPVRFLRYAREQFPHKLAVVCREQRFSYAQFGERAARLAGALLAAGAAPGDRIAFLSTNCHRLLESYYGVPEAGCTLLPLNVRLAPAELAYVLNDAEASILLFERRFLRLVEQFRHAVPSVRKFIVLDGEPKADWMEPQNYEALLAAAAPCQRDVMGVDENSVAELFYTSGGYEHPKGVMLTHRNVYLHALSVMMAMQTSPLTSGLVSCNDVELHLIPLFHTNGWGAAHVTTFVGGTHVLIHSFDVTEVCRVIEQERVTSCGMVPLMAAALVNSAARSEYDLTSLRRITLGGAASSPRLVRAVEETLRATCFSGYGMTETSPVLAMSPAKTGVDWDDQHRYAGQAKTGYAIPGVELRVVDGAGRDVPRDGHTVGEIIARGDGVMAGYWRQPELTAAVVENGWLYTGDVATLDEHGYLQIVDRKKDIIISGGENISSPELERALVGHPAIHEAAVIAAPDARWGEVPMAVVVLKPGHQISETDLFDFCRARLAHYKCPRTIEFVDSLPKCSAGKVLKIELRKKYWSQPAAVA
jgi:fatty-acyl-CoA synthase